jgi:hypothetical protein
MQLIPCFAAGNDLPASYFDWLALCVESMPAEELPAVELLRACNDFIHLSTLERRSAFKDGQPATADLIQKALDVDAGLEAWESSTSGKWTFEVGEGKLPPEACFHGQYHLYSDMWTARTWNHYRWARALSIQTVLRLLSDYPKSARPLIFAAKQQRCLSEVKRLAEDVMISIPSHYKHPILTLYQRDLITSEGGSGVGVSGVPATLHHLTVACSGPGVPQEHLDWAINMLDTIWGDMGIMQAKSLGGVLRKRRDAIQHPVDSVILKREPVY